MSSGARGGSLIVAASIGAVEALKDQLGVCRWNYALRSIQQRAKTSVQSILPPKSSSSSASGMVGNRMIRESEKIKRAEKAMKKVMDLSSWGPNIMEQHDDATLFEDLLSEYLKAMTLWEIEVGHLNEENELQMRSTTYLQERHTRQLKEKKSLINNLKFQFENFQIQHRVVNGQLNEERRALDELKSQLQNVERQHHVEVERLGEELRQRTNEVAELRAPRQTTRRRNRTNLFLKWLVIVAMLLQLIVEILSYTVGLVWPKWLALSITILSIFHTLYAEMSAFMEMGKKNGLSKKIFCLVRGSTRVSNTQANICASYLLVDIMEQHDDAAVFEDLLSEYFEAMILREIEVGRLNEENERQMSQLNEERRALEELKSQLQNVDRHHHVEVEHLEVAKDDDDIQSLSAISCVDNSTIREHVQCNQLLYEDTDEDLMEQHDNAALFEDLLSKYLEAVTLRETELNEEKRALDELKSQLQNVERQHHVEVERLDIMEQHNDASLFEDLLSEYFEAMTLREIEVGRLNEENERQMRSITGLLEQHTRQLEVEKSQINNLKFQFENFQIQHRVLAIVAMLLQLIVEIFSYTVGLVWSKWLALSITILSIFHSLYAEMFEPGGDFIRRRNCLLYDEENRLWIPMVFIFEMSLRVLNLFDCVAAFMEMGKKNCSFFGAFRIGVATI
ncbi:hypothetical protein BUALT_Bualt03G0129400 [Buddleja alternifolia]|uniref:Uncharacterized protein n=1 Tax=Buddleja alternifolia TaxID=168488 RepID=A0AAV6Y4K8_9LAMI|nr:hypothetical protein BUALT_Bualt03G0129400 [Buddleja alternifolia]